MLKNLGGLSSELRPKMGAFVNEAKQKIAQEIENYSAKIKQKEQEKKFLEEQQSRQQTQQP